MFEVEIVIELVADMGSRQTKVKVEVRELSSLWWSPSSITPQPANLCTPESLSATASTRLPSHWLAIIPCYNTTVIFNIDV